MAKINPHYQPFLDILDEMRDLHLAKSADYGKDDDPYDNLRAAEDFGVAAWIGSMIRLNDKVKRVQSFALKGELINESVEDSLMDIAVYAALTLKLYREQEQ